LVNPTLRPFATQLLSRGSDRIGVRVTKGVVMTTAAEDSAGDDARGMGVKQVRLGADVYVSVPETGGMAAAEKARTHAVAGGEARAWSVPVAVLPVAAAVALVAAVRLGATRPGVLAAALLPLLAVLSAIDLRWRLVPNRIVFPAFVAALAFQLALAPGHAVEWLGAAVAAPLVMLLPAIVDRRAVGMGDVKLAALLGAALGVRVLSALLIGAFAVVPVAIVLLLRRGPAARGTAIPFVPFLAFGAAAVLLG
jgi:leader peptidase (prepilin peptidase)/N-methyltransferase